MEHFKLEIIISNTYLKELINKLEMLDVKGYTALEISRGKGLKQGEHLFQGLLPTSRSSLIFILCNKENMERVIDSIQNYIDDRHGLIFAIPLAYIYGNL